MPKVSTCPGVEQFIPLVTGQPVSEGQENLIQHLEQCDGCAETLQTLTGSDELADMLRVTGDSAQYVVDDSVQALMDRLRHSKSVMTRETVDHLGEATNSAFEQTEVEASGFTFINAAEQPDEIGRFGPYRILRILGSGGMGVVFEAKDVKLKRRVAMKVIRPNVASGTVARERFLREAQAMAAIDHENVVSIHHVDEINDTPFFTMPLLQGETLGVRLQREVKLPWQEVIQIGLQLAKGLRAAHARGVIHRDVKPGNVWLEQNEEDPTAPAKVKILDFGLTSNHEAQTHLTQVHDILGTPGYMAPEQALTEDCADVLGLTPEQVEKQEVSPKSDLFSLGCLLYHASTGQLPFPGDQLVQTLASLLLREPKDPRQLAPEMPDSLSQLILQLLAKNPNERSENAQAVIESLERIMQEQNVESPIQIAQPVQPPQRRGRWWITAVLLLALLPLGYFVIPGIIRITLKNEDGKTVHGQVIIDTDRHVQVNILQAGKQVQLFDAKSKRSFDLEVGEYEMVIKEMATGIETNAKSFNVKRNGKEVINVRLVLTQFEKKTPRVEKEQRNVIYREDFEGPRFEKATRLVEFGWAGTMSNVTVSRDDPHLNGRCINGTASERLAGTAVFANIPLDLSTDERFIVLECLAYASSGANGLPSHNGHIGFGRANPENKPADVAVLWTVGMDASLHKQKKAGWLISAAPQDVTSAERSLPVLNNSGFDRPIKLRMVLDRVTNRVFGRYDFGQGFKVTKYLTLKNGIMQSLNCITLRQSYLQPERFTGFKVDEIVVYSTDRLKPGAVPPTGQEPKAGDVITGALGMKFAYVPAGKFWMGNGVTKGGQKEVEIKEGFYAGIYEVTQDEWEAVMGNNPSCFSRSGDDKDKIKDVPDTKLKRFPVENVSWNHVQEFIRKLNEREKGNKLLYRLPTEEEWEYTCRGGPTSSQLYGDNNPYTYHFYFNKPTNLLSSTHANFDGDFPYPNTLPKGTDLGRTCGVGLYQSNCLGIYDLHGNVWEWTSSLYEPGVQVYRGGGWSLPGLYCRASHRARGFPDFADSGLGFRLLAVPSRQE